MPRRGTDRGGSQSESARGVRGSGSGNGFRDTGVGIRPSTKGQTEVAVALQDQAKAIGVSLQRACEVRTGREQADRKRAEGL
eukprot:2529689-Alexandrium_andersonii.AAC.1